MKQRLFALLLPLTLCLFATEASAIGNKVNGIYYLFTGANAKVTYDVNGTNNVTAYTGDIVIPETVTYQGITYTVTEIGNWAFQYCTNLTSLKLPNSITTFGDHAFFNYTNLTSFEIPNSISTVGMYAFSECSALESISIPNSVTSIGVKAFEKCTSLASLTLPESVVSIGNDAFNGCTSLASVDIPSSVKSVGARAFSGCSSLASVTLPYGVETIGGGAFSLCSSLTAVSIPSSVTSIGNAAFGDGSTNLTTVKVNIASPLTITSSTFFNRANATLYVPKGSKVAYQNAQYWREFKNIVEIIKGDVNKDGKVTIADVTALVDIILGKDGTQPFVFDHECADVNEDGNITIPDVSALVNIILDAE